tara:strand:- start:751 stop:1002 length:252 start_codon:yes stop_codon:yes gene_type:complete
MTKKKQAKIDGVFAERLFPSGHLIDLRGNEIQVGETALIPAAAIEHDRKGSYKVVNGEGAGEYDCKGLTVVVGPKKSKTRKSS